MKKILAVLLLTALLALSACGSTVEIRFEFVQKLPHSAADVSAAQKAKRNLSHPVIFPPGLPASGRVRRERRACAAAADQRNERFPAVAARPEASAELQDRCHTGRSRSILAQDAQGDPRGDDPI